jgi:nitrogen fixation NifU-like protein
MESDELYQELLLDHFKNPRCKGCLEHPSGDFSMKNPLCGDTIRVTIALGDQQGNKTVADVRYAGHGCSISQASASMMTELVRGVTVERARTLSTLFRKMMTETLSEEETGALGDAASLQGVKKFSARIRCALLAWETLDRALDSSEPAKSA